jgi:hypothetical protein
MALPRLNDTPKYSLVIPSTKKKIRFRPYLAREDMVLQMALEENDANKLLHAIADTVDACVADEIDLKSLTSFDVEYMFLKIRAKSVGETAKFVAKCKSCGTGNEQSINLDEIEVDFKNKERKVALTDTISVKLRWPGYYTLIEDQNLVNSKSSTESTIRYLTKFIDSIQTEDENMKASDFSADELIAFVGSFTSEQMQKINEFLKDAPSISNTVEYDCKNCGEHNVVEIKEMTDFF